MCQALAVPNVFHIYHLLFNHHKHVDCCFENEKTEAQTDYNAQGYVVRN